MSDADRSRWLRHEAHRLLTNVVVILIATLLALLV
jgi:hypothetical protein